jgi:hypothetical protein
MGNSYYFEVHQSPGVKALSIHPYANYMSPCAIRWLKYSEILQDYRYQECTLGQLSPCVFCPFPCGP